jgi:RimJ/RimL family protein N-acetyltransferase
VPAVPLDALPAARPARAPLSGRWARLEPADPERHADALFAAGHDGVDPALWDWLPYGPWEAAELRAHLAAATTSDDPLHYAICDAETGVPGGMAALMRITPEFGVIEIGHVWFGGALQRTRVATDAIHLLAREAFRLGNRRLEWKCDSGNARSRAAAARFGFTYEGTFRQHMVVKGRNRDTAWFSILDTEWPSVESAFAAWLDPANFDADGAQREPLRAAADRRAG